MVIPSPGRKRTCSLEAAGDGHGSLLGFADTAITAKRRREEAAIRRVKEHAPVHKIEKEAAVALEDGFFRQQLSSDEQIPDPNMLPVICEGFCAVVEARLRYVQETEARYYYDLPDSHSDRQKLLALERVLQMEVVAWKVILALSNSRTRRSARVFADDSMTSVASEQDFVASWTKQQPVVCDIETVVTVLEETYQESHPSELLLPSLVTNPNRPRMLLSYDLERLKDISESKSDGLSDEEVFEGIFRCIRAGDVEHAKVIAKRGGLALFNSNFWLRKYSTHAPSVNAVNNRLRWKNTAWRASSNVQIGRWQRAVWAILCGNYGAVLPVAETWEDAAWIYFRCFIDISVEKALLEFESGAATVLSVLPEEYWSQDLSITDLFARINGPANLYCPSQVHSIFQASIKAAVLNDLQDALVEIERIVFVAAELFGGENLVLNKDINPHDKGGGCGIRFALHALLMLKRAGLTIDSTFLGRSCYLHIQTTVGQDPQLWAFYFQKIPEDLRLQAVKYFLTNHLPDVKEKIKFLRALVVQDVTNTSQASREILRDRFLANYLNLDADDLVALADLYDVLLQIPGSEELLLGTTNRVIRALLLQDPPEAQKANEFFAALSNAVDCLVNSVSSADLISANLNSLRVEIISWKRYLEICAKFTEWNEAQEALLSGVSGLSRENLDKIVQDTTVAGFCILSTQDFLSNTGSYFPEEPDRKKQLETLRGRILTEVYSSLMNILHHPIEPASAEDQISLWENMMDLTSHIVQLAIKNVIDIAAVKDAVSSAVHTAEDVLGNQTSARHLPANLKKKLYRVRDTVPEMVRESLKFIDDI